MIWEPTTKFTSLGCSVFIQFLQIRHLQHCRKMEPNNNHPEPFTQLYTYHSDHQSPVIVVSNAELVEETKSFDLENQEFHPHETQFQGEPRYGPRGETAHGGSVFQAELPRYVPANEPIREQPRFQGEPQYGPHGERIVPAKKIERDCYWWTTLSISIILNVGFYFVTLYFVIMLVFLDKNGKQKPFKAACFSKNEMDDHICFFSAGLISYGIISVGEVSIGLFTLGQVSLGLVFAFGQAACGWGFSCGQIASGWYVYFAQVGLAMYRVCYAQLSFQVLYSINPNLGLDSLSVQRRKHRRDEVDDEYPITTMKGCNCD
jgi:hypothetical protein